MQETEKALHGTPWAEWLARFPQLDDLAAARPTYWNNIHSLPASLAVTSCGFTAQDVEDASLRLKRFAPLIAKLFPETEAAGGVIESPLREVPAFQSELERRHALPRVARLLVKLDSHLPVSGSVQDRGGVYEVLKLAEDLAMNAQLLKWSDNYTALFRSEIRELFAGHGVTTAGAGNLDLAVGAVARALGFKARAHISAEVKPWKKDLLRSKGIDVVVHEGDYAEALRQGREEAAADPDCHFVDGENSRALFLGHATAAVRFKEQLGGLGVSVSAEHPLYVYLPCGSGGGAGGVCFGLKLLFGDNVRCCFVEPVEAPAMFLGLGTRLFGESSVQEIGLSGRTEADDLGMGRPSTLACKAMRELLDFCVTVPDAELFNLLALLHDTERLRLEPSALAGAAGYINCVCQGDRATPARGSHVLWATCGSLMPHEEWLNYYEKAAKAHSQVEECAAKTPDKHSGDEFDSCLPVV